MKVLAKGRDRNLGRKLTCSNCAALLLVLPCDVNTSNGCYMGESETSYYVTCPECNEVIEVNYTYLHIPRHSKNE